MTKKLQEKKTSLSNAIIIGAVLAIAGFFIGLYAPKMFANFAPFLGASTSSNMDWSSLDDVYNRLSASYDGEISKKDVIEGAKKGLTEALGDIYTVYMDAEEAKAYNDSLHGNIGSGVGIEMGLRDGYVRVLRTLPDNPAGKAGILAGDIIYKVNDEEVYSLSTDEIANKIRGETGSEVSITVVRNGQEFTYTMKREAINNVSAYVEYDGTTAIITVTRFDTDTGVMVQNFTREFADKGINKVILDLRNNGGGYVDAAITMIGLWVDNDIALIQKSAHYKDEVQRTNTSNAPLANMKTVVLVNGSTASASEIVAGALQDYGKATILGETTYGKGVVQQMFSMPGSAMLKVTIASWYTPNGRTINKTGIEPDVKVERSYDDINAMRDPQLDAAKNL